jgi:hypothetical protein
MPANDPGTFDFMHVMAAYAVTAGTAALGWIWRTDRKVALMDNDHDHHHKAFLDLKESYIRLDSKIDHLSDTLKEIQHDMPKRKTEQK